MNVGSLFSGIGGVELGFEREGFETAWFVEYNKFCQKVLRKHWPDVPIYGDITEIDFNELPKVDVLTGGFPCQDISVAGKGVGISGSRSGLWSYFNKAIGILRPKYAIIENVPMLVKRGLNVVLGNLAENGYDAEWFCLSARDFGALHKRERIFIIAYPPSKRWNNGGDCGERGQILPAEKREVKKNKQERNRRKLGLDTNTSVFITHDFRNRIQRHKQEIQREPGFSRFQNVRRLEDLQGIPDLPKPLIRGGNDGVPNRVDRTKSIGNAVVPQVAQFIARRIKEIEAEE